MGQEERKRGEREKDSTPGEDPSTVEDPTTVHVSEDTPGTPHLFDKGASKGVRTTCSHEAVCMADTPHELAHRVHSDCPRS